MTKEEALKRFHELYKPERGMEYDTVIIMAVEAMAQVIAEAVEEATEQAYIRGQHSMLPD